MLKLDSKGVAADLGAINKKTSKLHPFKVSPRNVDQYKSSKLSYMFEDFARLGVTREQAAKILMARGVVKAHNIKRGVLRLQLSLSSRLGAGYRAIENGTFKRPNRRRVPQDVRDYYLHLGQLMAIKQVNFELSRIATQSTFRVPDNDPNFRVALRVSGISLIKG